MNLKKQIFAMAKQDIKTIIFPEANFSNKVMQAIKYLVQKKLAKVIIVGDETAMYLRFSSVDSSDLKIINSKTSPLKEEVIEKLKTLLVDSKLSEEELVALAEDSYNFATILVKLGYADAIISASDGNPMRVLNSAFKFLRTKKQTVSSGSILCGKNRFLKNNPVFVTDNFVNFNPTAQDLVGIAKNASDFWRIIFLSEPKIAFIANSTNGSIESDASQKMQTATKLFAKKYEDVVCDGEMQLEVALDTFNQNLKFPDCKLNGPANILVVPDATSGCFLAKSMKYIAGLTFLGPITFGFDAPISDISRSSSIIEIVLLCAITAIQAQC